MSKKPTKDSLTKNIIEEQTAAFLKTGGAVEYVLQGTSGQVAPPASTPAGASSNSSSKS